MVRGTIFFYKNIGQLSLYNPTKEINLRNVSGGAGKKQFRFAYPLTLG